MHSCLLFKLLGGHNSIVKDPSPWAEIEFQSVWEGGVVWKGERSTRVESGELHAEEV